MADNRGSEVSLDPLIDVQQIEDPDLHLSIPAEK